VCVCPPQSSCLCAWARRKAAARARGGQGDFPAKRMIESVTGVCAARRARLMRVLDIDPEWRMHRVSDGQRRRVQICLGLLHPFQAGPPPPPPAERGQPGRVPQNRGQSGRGTHGAGGDQGPGWE